MIVSVASGKGGTGKTLVATSLALSLKDVRKVQLLDCDVEEPNSHLLLRPTIDRTRAVWIPVPKVDQRKCTYCGKCAEACEFHALAVFPGNVLLFAQLCHGCGACSYLCPEEAMSEELRQVGVVESGSAGEMEFVQGEMQVGEPMPGPVIEEVKRQANNHGTVIIDCPPGTSCPVVRSVESSDFCLLVTEPTPFGLNDLALAVAMVKEIDVPCGVVLNRAGAGDDRVEEYCRSQGIPLLLTIPLDRRIARFYSRGVTLAEGMPEWKEEFRDLFNRIRELANERSGSTER